MIDRFQNYLKSGKAKSKTADIVEANSLLERSKKRMKYIRSLNEDTSFLVLEDAYESAREAAQALMSKNGFKPYSHEATISFIREFYNKEFDEYKTTQFDRFREIRNNALYKGQPVSLDDVSKCFQFAKDFINKVELILEKK